MRPGDCKHCGKGYMQHEGKRCMNKLGTEFEVASKSELLRLAIEENTEVSRQQLRVSEKLLNELASMHGTLIELKNPKNVIKLLERTTELLERFEDERKGRR